MFAPRSSSLRYTLPRAELYANDRQSRAYPTKARTGDRTRTGRNKFYFDDTQTVIFATGVNVNLPTSFHTGSNHLAHDLTSNFVVLGNTRADSVDSWIVHRDQVEVPGPFVEDKLFEQDQHALINSAFMTGAAHAISPDKFKMGVSSKTAVRITLPISSSTTLSPESSSLYYFNPTLGKLDVIANERYSENNQSSTPFNFLTSLTMFDPILFTPFGYLNVPCEYSPLTAQSSRFFRPSAATFAINDFVPNGATVFDFHFNFLIPGQGYRLATGSLINSQHNAHPTTQSISLENYLTSPFLLEKAVVEFPFAAGPGWMNDAYVMDHFIEQANANQIARKKVDAGGPMITVALLRQDSSAPFHRDLIASGTFTNAFDALESSYKKSSLVYNDSAGSGQTATQEIYARTGLSGTVDPAFVVRGPVVSGSTNYFTGSVRLLMTPAVTHHITRTRLSGTSRIGFYRDPNVETGANNQDERLNMAYLTTFGCPTRRPGVFESGRSVLGNNVAALPTRGIDGTDVPVKKYETDHESLNARAGGFERAKVYWDVISATKESPYILYPTDKLVLCFNKHRSTANSASFKVTASMQPATLTMRAQHDAQLMRGAMVVTLYGSQIREEREFHDTLNQRLESAELWETIGDDPVLDQFDVVYAHEMSGSYIDRFRVGQVFSLSSNELSSSLETTQLYSHMSQQVFVQLISPSFAWMRAKKINELRSNSRNVQAISKDELFWDCRLLNPVTALTRITSGFKLTPQDPMLNPVGYTIYSGLSMAGSAGNYSESGAGDWFMTYPFESKYKDVITQFELGSDTFKYAHTQVNTPFNVSLNYANSFMFQLGDYGYRKMCAGDMESQARSPLPQSEFIKFFYGIGDGVSRIDNQHVTTVFSGSIPNWNRAAGAGAQIRGWKYGMVNGFKTYTKQIFRRDRFGQFRDMLEQRLDAKFYDEGKSMLDGSQGGTVADFKESPVRVSFYDRTGNPTDSLLTLSSNLSTEATSSMPYTDGQARNRVTIDYGNINISPVTF